VGEVASHRFEETRLSVRKFAPHEWPVSACRLCADGRTTAAAPRRNPVFPTDATRRASWLGLGPSRPRLHIFEERMTLRIGGILEAHVGADCEVRRRKMRGPRARAPFMDA
jgi:hypothetical protein